MDCPVTYIYSLSHPLTGEVRYVGKADDPNYRYRKHITQTGFSHKENWIKYLKGRGLVPELNIIDSVPIENWEFWERHYIKLFKSFGAKLTNSSNGGEGNVGYKTSEATKQKLRLANLGKKLSEDHKAKVKKNNAKFWLGKKRTQSVIDKISATKSGTKLTDQQKRNISNALAGRKLSAQHKDNLSKRRRITVAKKKLQGVLF